MLAIDCGHVSRVRGLKMREVLKAWQERIWGTEIDLNPAPGDALLQLRLARSMPIEIWMGTSLSHRGNVCFHFDASNEVGRDKEPDGSPQNVTWC